MNPFPRDRYDPSEFVRSLDSAPVERGDDNQACIFLTIRDADNHEMEIEIYFPGWADNPPPELLQLARRTCECITQLDNLVQDSCETEWRRGKISSDDYELFLANIEIETDLVRLEYYGTKVNTNWAAVFVPSDRGVWAKVNF